MGDAYYENGNDLNRPLSVHPADMVLTSIGSLVRSLLDTVIAIVWTTSKFSPVCNVILTAVSANITMCSEHGNDEEGRSFALGRGRGEYDGIGSIDNR